MPSSTTLGPVGSSNKRPITDSPVVFHVCALAVILLSFVVRMYRLGDVAIEFDEAFSIRAAASKLSDMIHAVATYEPHPPFYYAFLHFWQPAFGASELALRFPTVVANVLTVVVLIRLADSLGWRWPGVLAGLLFALNPYQVWYAQEARMYAPVTFFGLFSVYCALQTVNRGRRRDLVGYAAFMLLALYTHYYAIFLGVFVNLLVLILLWFGDERTRSTRQPRLFRWLAAQVVVALLYLPWLIYGYRISLYYSRPQVQLSDMLRIIATTLVDFSVGTSLPLATANTAALGFLVVLLIGLWGVRCGGPRWSLWRRYLLIAGYLLLPLTLGFVTSFYRSMFQPRYFLVSAPAFFLLLGLGARQTFRINRLLGIAATLLLIVIQLQSLRNYFFDPRYDKSEPADAIERVARLVGSGDGVILDGWGQSNQFWYYHDLLKSEPAPGYLLPLSGPGGWDATLPEIDKIMAAHRGVWLLTYTAREVDGQRLIEGYLNRNYFPVISLPIITNSVTYFVPAPASPPRVTPIDDTCNGTLVLEAVEDYGTSARAGSIVPLTLRWRATGPISQNYGVSWRLLDSRGHTVLQRDAPPASGFAPTTTWKTGQEVLDRYGLLVPADLPPGAYNLEAIVFDRLSGAECTFHHRQSALAGPAVPLTTIQVLDAPPAPAIDRPIPARPATTAFGPLTLEGYDLDPGPYRPGDSLSPRLYWRVNNTPSTDLVATVRLIDTTGTVVAEEQEKVGPPGFPTRRWQPGRDVASFLDVPIPPRTQSGSYQLSVTLAGSTSGVAVRIGPIPIVARPHSFQVPAIAHPLRATFGGEISLLGLSSPVVPGQTIQPGGTLAVSLVWRDLQPVPKNYKVFTHLVGPDGKIYGQDDAVPKRGQAPTESWIPGEIIVDQYRLLLNAKAPAGRYSLVVGFYDPTTGARLPLAGGNTDTVTVATYRIGA